MIKITSVEMTGICFSSCVLFLPAQCDICNCIVLLQVYLFDTGYFCAIFAGAIASNEVKQKVHEFILSKKQREQAVKELTGSPPQFRHPWYVQTLQNKIQVHSLLKKFTGGSV